MRRPPLAFVAVTGLLAGSLLAAQLSEPARRGGPAAAASLEPVVGRLVVCPELVKTGSDVKTRLTAGTAEPGRLRVHAATLTPAGGLGPVVLDRGGRVGLLDLRGDNALAVAVTASGERAGALEAEQVSRGADGIQRGYANVRCEPTSQDTWFVGGSTAQTADTQLVLVNPYDEPALVRLELFTRSGRVDTPSAEGIVVARRARLVLRLADLVPDEPALAVHVVALEGRIAPAMRDARASGDTPLGVDWVPRAGQPAEQVDLTGLPDGIGRRLLYLFVPGEDDATVRIQTTYADGQFVPDGLEEVRVPAGRVTIVNLTDVVSAVDRRTADRVAKPVSLRVQAEGAPVLATAFAENNARFSKIREIGYAGPSEPLTGPSLVTDNAIAGGIESTVHLVAPDGAARMSAELVPVTGRSVGGRRVTFEVPQGRLVRFQIHRRYAGAGIRAVVFTPLPGSSPVFASRYLFERGQRGPLFSILGLVSQPGSGVPVPVTVSDPRAALVDPRDGVE